MYNGGGTTLLLSTSSLRYLGKRIGLSSSVQRVPALYSVSQSQHYSNLLLKPRLTTSRLRRTYAQKVVSKPKANTGRATTAAKKAPTTSATKAAKKPAPKKTTPKSVPKAKSKAKPVKKKTKAKAKVKKPKVKKPKAKKAKKPKVKKPKAKKPKKVLTAEEKTKATIKELKAKALKAPPTLITATWHLFLQEKLKAMEKVEEAAKGSIQRNFGAVASEASAAYKALLPEQVEVCRAFEGLAPPA